MRVLRRGHTYEAAHRHPDPSARAEQVTTIQFVNTEAGQEVEGVTTQELCRILIDRTTYCNNCLPHWVNALIIAAFRKIILLHEIRALERKVDKDELRPEMVRLGVDGHFLIEERDLVDQMEETELKPVEPGQVCQHRSHL